MPISWLEWSKEAFERSRKEKKPVLLDIYGVWCHWCHRMMHDNYEDEDVANVINENFIPIKVDTDKRPDINERYNQGGWPTTVFLDCDGNIITGATYVPPHEFGFMLEQVKNFYQKNAGSIPKMTEKEKKQTDVDFPEIVEHLEQAVVEHFDINYGGFGHGQKFPMNDVLEFCMARYHLTKNKQFRLFATMTLDNMTGIMDKIEGGFFRYATDRQWSVPHYEKMLEGNAEIISSYLSGYEMTGKNEYLKIAEKTIEYAMNNLHGEAFYASQDADEDYYSLDDRKNAVKPKVDKTMFTSLNAKMISALLLASIHKKEYRKTALDAMEFVLKNMYSAEKGFRHFPEGQYGLLADNVQMLKALLDAYEITADEKYLKHAKDAADFVEKNFFSGTTLSDRIHAKDDIGLLAMRNRNLAENSRAAECLVRIAFYFENDSYRNVAEKILKDMEDIYGMYSFMAAPYTLVIEKLLHGVQIKLQCNREEYEEALKIFNPLKMMKYLGEGSFAASVCKGTVCMQPAKSIDELKKVLE